MELSERILNFLGKPIADADFQGFLNETESYEHFGGEGHEFYQFAKLGLMIHAHDTVNIDMASFHIQSRHVEEGAFAPYKELLPFGISTADTRKQVARKLGVQPFRSTPDQGYPDKAPEEYPTWWDRYSMPPLRLTFLFRSAVDGMAMLSVNYTPGFDAVTVGKPK